MDSGLSFSATSFYGDNYKIKESLLKPAIKRTEIVPYKINNLLSGPPLTWKVFKRQVEALDFISRFKHDLMGFAFESNGTRLFLVAHPEVFWHYDHQRPPECRCSYEIIPMNTVCKLYFDLEFNIPLNPGRNGSIMVKNFIALIIFYLKEELKVNCELHHVINLDASTEIKFSRHLIFNIPYICFANNIQAGNFVSFVCRKIFDVTENKLEVPPELNFLTPENFSDMIVIDAKGRKTLFCDLSVYSKNRHFRLYKSTKYGKSAPLLLSSDSGIVNGYESEKELFISSLITYLPIDFEKLKVLFFESNIVNYKLSGKTGGTASHTVKMNEPSSSPYHNIDNFINELVYPGKIYRSFYFPSSKVINYDIVGNRFCGNIGRPHKSNNIKYVVDLKDNMYYQKCHDYECSSYKSDKKLLPKNLQLIDSVDLSSNLGEFNISENKNSFDRFPSCGLSDEDIINHLSSQPIGSIDLRDEQIDHLSNSSMQRFPSFDLSDEEILNHLSSQNFIS